MFKSKIFTLWFVAALVVWIGLAINNLNLQFFSGHLHYPLIMVLGAFVAGLTPEGGGAVAFPVLSVFFEIDRVLARDFSLMIQSVGMTSASIFILTHRETRLRMFVPVLWFLPVCFAGFVVGMLLLQSTPVYLIQALFLSLITAFAIAYVRSDHRGSRHQLNLATRFDYAMLAAVLLTGGLCASLFGTGSDILLYTILVTRFRMTEKVATRMSIVLMAGMSVLGFAYRQFVDADLTPDQFRTWISAFPVVLFMAPFGALVLTKLNIEWMLRAIVILNVGQLAYFNLNKPSLEKTVASGCFTVVLLVVFLLTLSHISPSSAKRVAEPT